MPSDLSVFVIIIETVLVSTPIVDFGLIGITEGNSKGVGGVVRLRLFG